MFGECGVEDDVGEGFSHAWSDVSDLSGPESPVRVEGVFDVVSGGGGEEASTDPDVVHSGVEGGLGVFAGFDEFIAFGGSGFCGGLADAGEVAHGEEGVSAWHDEESDPCGAVGIEEDAIGVGFGGEEVGFVDFEIGSAHLSCDGLTDGLEGFHFLCVGTGEVDDAGTGALPPGTDDVSVDQAEVVGAGLGVKGREEKQEGQEDEKAATGHERLHRRGFRAGRGEGRGRRRSRFRSIRQG